MCASRSYLYVYDVWLEFEFMTFRSKLCLSWEMWENGAQKPVGDVLETSMEEVYEGAQHSVPQ